MRTISIRRPLMTLFIGMMLAGCAALERTPDGVETDATQQAQGLYNWLTQLVGDYESARQWQPDSSSGTESPITRLQFVRQDRGTVLMTQQTGPTPARQFLWVFGTPRPNTLTEPLSGQFITLGPDGQMRGQCPLRVSALADGLVAETIPDQCRFETEQGQMGLLKELAFDGQRVIIADQLVDLDSGQDVGSARLLETWRSMRFTGWAGRLDGADHWRLARPIVVDSRQSGIEPLDAAGMDLGLSLQLDYYQPRDSTAPLLRLRLDSENSDGEITTTQVWADKDATEIGLSLPAVQVGLTRQP
jgi:hypothetical protein